MASWPTAVATDSNLYLAVNELQTNLSSGVNSAVTTLPLNSTTSFPTVGLVLIDNEVIKYTGVSGSNLTGCTRGFDGTTAASHSSAAIVSFAIMAAHHNVLKDEIEAIEATLRDLVGLSATLPLTVSVPVKTDASGHLTTGSITNADIAAATGITLSKLAALGTAKALQSNASTGFIEVSSVTNTELGYLSGVTSAIQTQLTGKASTDLSNVASVSANVPMNTHKFTGLSAGSASGDSVRWEQVLGFRVLQIITANTSTNATSTSTSYADTNLTATITPSLTTSKVLVFVTQEAEASGGNGITVCSVQLLRAGSIIYGPFPATYQAAVVANDINTYYPICYLDSPASTSALIYKTQFARAVGTGTASVQGQPAGVATNSTITLIEIG